MVRATTYKSSSGQDGKLPYRARILLPIRYTRTEAEMNQAQTASQLQSGHRKGQVVTAGFLGVDTDSPGLYDEMCDVQLGLIVADALFPVLKRSWLAEDATLRRSKQGPTTDAPRLPPPT
jgi:hypothetical protein